MLDEMKEASRSEQHPATVVKKKSSSGCLIIKKKVTDSVSGASDSSLRNLYNNKPSKKKKRCRVVAESIDNQSDQKVDKFHNGSVVYNAAYLEDAEFGSEKRVKSNGLDVFEFDEYDGFDESRIRKDANDGSSYNRWKLSNRPSGDQMESENDIESDDESDLPLSVLSKKYRLSSNKKPIRLQGKNGVLKVMVNNNKPKEPTTPRVVQNKKLNASVKSSKSKLANSKINESDTVTQLKSSCSKREVVKNRVKGGSGTEKQLLREKIKNMLFGAGWTIDYRPRRNRDYMDAVYINPAGTGYWSIIKAYDALQKEQEEEDNSSKAGGNFTPLPEEILGKLTRQTRNKIQREEMKNKRKSRNAEVNEESDSDQEEEEKLNSHVNKSKKSKLEEASQKSRKIGRCSLLVRSSDKRPDSECDGVVSYPGKRTLLSWLIDSEVVHMSQHVQYMNRRKTRVMQKGWITKDGIHCGCCSKIVPVLKFELHAGSKLRQPFQNIYLESGKSLMQCQIDAWNKQGELEQKGFYTVDVAGDDDDPNDDTCGLCGDGGDLICCDGCPSTFHQSCLDIQMLPQGDWHCPYCSCKYCEIDGGNCTAVCDKNEAPLFVCCFCQKKYHESCRPEKDLNPLESNQPNLLFCEQKCQELQSRLQKLFGVKHELDSGFSWSLIHRSNLSTDTSSVELSRRVECNSMLAVAMSVMNECFLPIADKRSGTNLIRNVVFNCGSNLGRLNYSGFFTAILERGDEVVCAASIRIHGTELAEMPFIGTRHMYRRQGMCRRLLSAIESALSSLKVEKLIIPAIAEHMHTWTDVFGFHSLEESHKQELRSMNMLVFPGTDMLQKPLVKSIPKGNKTAATDSGSKNVPVPANRSELISSSSCGNTDIGQFSQPDPSCKTSDVDSHPATVSSDCEPQLQLSVSFDSNVEESTVDNKITTQIPAGDDLVYLVVLREPELHDTTVEEIGDGSDLLSTQVHDHSDDKVPTDTPFRSDLHVHLKEEIDVLNGCETTTNNTTDVISLEDQAPPNAPSNSSISSDSPSGLESLATGKNGVKDMIQISEDKEGSCESEMNTKEKGKSIPGLE